MAREHGVAGAVVDAIGRGEDPPFEADDERAVYTGGPPARSTLAAWTRRRTMRRTAFSATPGWWSWCRCAGTTRSISFLLNAFTVPLPPDALPMWA